MGQGGRLQGGTLCRGAGWCCAVGWDDILWGAGLCGKVASCGVL